MIQKTLLVAATLVLIPALAAEEAPAGAPTPTGAPQAPPSLLDRRFDLDFPGGTLEELLVAVEHALGERPNFMVGPGCGEATLPSFSLRSVSTSLLFDAIENFLEEHRIRTIERKGEVIVFMKQPDRRGQGPTYLGSGAERRVQPFDLAPFLTTFTVDDIVTAIETAWDMLDVDSKATLRYHQETNLLLIAGESQQLAVVSNILNNLQQQIYDEANRKQQEEMSRQEAERRAVADRDRADRKAAEAAAQKAAEKAAEK